METRRLELLAELSRLRALRGGGGAGGATTPPGVAQSAPPPIEPPARRARLTPAGRRLAEHAVTILAAVESAQLDLTPGAEPSGTVRVAGFSTAFRMVLLPVITGLAA